MKTRKCRECKAPYTPWNSTVIVCSPKCAIEYAHKQVEKRNKAKFNDKKRRFKDNDVGVQKREASKAFNAYIRERDREDGCISCGDRTRQMHAGHYKTRGAHPEIAFNDDNCHKQCSICNNYKSGNLVAYRERLIEKIGKKRVVALESYHEPVKRTAKDYREIKIEYRKKLKLLKELG